MLLTGPSQNGGFSFGFALKPLQKGHPQRIHLLCASSRRAVFEGIFFGRNPRDPPPRTSPSPSPPLWSNALPSPFCYALMFGWFRTGLWLISQKGQGSGSGRQRAVRYSGCSRCAFDVPSFTQPFPRIDGRRRKSVPGLWLRSAERRASAM